MFHDENFHMIRRKRNTKPSCNLRVRLRKFAHFAAAEVNTSDAPSRHRRLPTARSLPDDGVVVSRKH